MVLIERLLQSLIAAAFLLWLQRLARRQHWPKLPLRLSVGALVAWLALPLLASVDLPARALPWISLLDELLLSLAGARLALWVVLELPSGLGWWRRPPDLLVQLLMLAGGTVITVIVVQQAARFDLMGLVTTSAVLTAVVGLAAQESLKDLFAGLELQLANDFRLGDWLELEDGRDGVVETISWRTILLRNEDGCRLIIPNSKITDQVIINRSASGVASNRFQLGLDYSFAPARAQELLDRVARQHPQVLTTPAPRVRIREFGDSAVIYELHVWQREMDHLAMLELRSSLQEQIWYALQRAGQSIPFPVRELQPRRRTPVSATDQDLISSALVALERSDLFGVMSPQQRQQLAGAGRAVWFGPGEVVVREGEPGDSSYLVLDGCVQVLKTLAPGRQATVRRLQADDLFGEMTLLLDSPRSATVQAVEECLLLQLDRAALKPLLQANPDLLERLAQQVRASQRELDALSSTGDAQPDTSLLGTMRRLFAVVTGGSFPPG